MAAPVPLVGPGKHKSACAAGGKGGAHLPVERARLGLGALAAAVQSNLGQNQRSVARQVVQPRQVGGEGLLRLQVDVETNEIDERELQILGGGIVDVGD